jgi:F-type H+-transporting ATPase subunit epsilon
MFKLDFYTPESTVTQDQDLAEITLPGHKGELNLLPGHVPLMTTLSPGILSYRLVNGETRKFAISWGYCQVSDRGVTVLAEQATAPDQIDLAQAQAGLKEAQEKLLTESLDDDHWNQAQSEIQALRAQMELAQRP